MNTRSRGRYYERKTIEWLEAHGYHHIQRICRLTWLRRGNRLLPVMHDVFGADIVALSPDNELEFFQVKLGKSKRSVAQKQLDIAGWDQRIKRWIVLWTPRAREPELVLVNERR